MTVRNPPAKARVIGADLKNPARYRGRNAPQSSPIGDPPAGFTEEQRAAWYQFEAELPWLARSHRAILEVASVLRAKVGAGAEGVNALQTYSAVLSKLGATPADASRVAWSDEDDEGPAEKFFGWAR